MDDSLPTENSLPFGRLGRFWRGNLHTHTDRSDGALSPAETARHYRQAGYDFLAITDHFRARFGFPLVDTRDLRTEGFTTLIGAELHAPRTEFSDEWHIIAVGLPLGFPRPEPEETGPALARRARAAGAFIGMAHPAASLLTLADAESLDAAHAVEVHNALAALEDRGDSWVHVRAVALDPNELLAALKAGHYYASTGPELHDVELREGQITVRCSPVRRILLTGGVPGKQVLVGKELTEGSLPVAMFGDGYCRVTVEDAAGGRAWTNPIHLRRP
ncbi:PHP domain-containing protein [Candidatus Frankia nodulisporulans]|uniref:PHP domain-containing protein n=1 Tax=Candidatus Frankia nodulisporulans TaxID=2060052 RepID=UPI0013D171D8|nr:PHP domain-containing protein [Candidatus Frankia nodulisporulans]